MRERRIKQRARWQAILAAIAAAATSLLATEEPPAVLAIRQDAGGVLLALPAHSEPPTVVAADDLTADTVWRPPLLVQAGEDDTGHWRDAEAFWQSRRFYRPESPPATRILGAGAEYRLRIEAWRAVRAVPPGVVGWGAMWKREFLQPPPPATMTDAEHAAYIEQLAEAQAPWIAAADVRHLSWPWGVSFSTWAVNWENSASPWSQRRPDCVRVGGRVSPWCEVTVVGVGDLLTLAARWGLEAVTVAVPLAVSDGAVPRWGPNPLDQSFSAETIERISDHARRLVDFMKAHPAWNALHRVYLAAGCEWRHYSLVNPSPAVLSYAALVRRMRARIPESKVVLVASASDSTDLPGVPQWQAFGWNRYLHEQLHDVPGVALDLHRYRGDAGLEPAPDGSTALTATSVDRLLETGRNQRDFLAVHPSAWGGTGRAMPTVLLENAIHGLLSDHSTRSSAPRPWVVALAHADLVREALASPALAFLGWTWFPEDLPAEWPHGAVRDGQLASHAAAQAFLSRYHRGFVLRSFGLENAPVRGNATRTAEGRVRAYGGNFSRQSHRLGFELLGEEAAGGQVECLTEGGLTTWTWDGQTPLELPPLCLWRIEFE